MERQVITIESLPIPGWKQRSSLGREDFAVQYIFPEGNACKIQMLIPTLTFVAGASNCTGTFVQTKGKAKKWNDIFLPSSLLSMACSAIKNSSVKGNCSAGSYPKLCSPLQSRDPLRSTLFLKRMGWRIISFTLTLGCNLLCFIVYTLRNNASLVVCIGITWGTHWNDPDSGQQG